MMKNIKIPVGTDLNEIISHLNQERKLQTAKQNDFHFEQWIFEALPDPLPKLLGEIHENAKKDTALLSILVMLSSLIKDYKVYYADKQENCQLYVYILADAGQGKGAVAKFMDLGMPFHKELLEQFKEQISEYKIRHKEWEDNGQAGEEPKQPVRKVLFIAGNNCKASLIRDLSGNDGFGVIFETETDTLYAANKSEFGNFSDILRKGFHSENLSVNRIGFEDGAVEIDKVILNVLLSSTLDQCFKLIPTYENGLFSRFAFYILPDDLEFKQVFTKVNTQKIYTLIKKVGEQFKLIGLENLKRYDKEFILTTKQQDRFLLFFRFINDTSIKNGRKYLKGNINRLGLICTRIAMLLTYLRNFNLKFDPEATSENQNLSISGEISCNDIDFDIALSVAQILVCHLLMVDDLYQYMNPKQSNSISIHSNKRYNKETKLEAIRLRHKGMPYSKIADTILNDPSLKGTIQKWVSKKDSIAVSVSETETNLIQPKTIDVISELKKATVSFFDTITQADTADTFDLYNLVTTDLFKDQVEEVRSADDSNQKRIKMKLPAFTASGVYKNGRRKDCLQKHSGFICIDIDKQDNNQIENFAELKKELSNIVNVAFIGRSVSGKGFYILIPLDSPEKHEGYFNAIQEAINSLGIIIDKSCKDVSRLRIVSYDKSYYMADKAIVINTTLESNTDMKAFEFVDDERFTNTINAIEKQKIDITKRYAHWFGIGCAIANTFNEKGRGYFHAISKFYPKYDVKETDEQYSACLKNARENGYSLGTFFYLASLHDINV